jgi:two-component system sensor histidine kinase SenX3
VSNLRVAEMGLVRDGVLDERLWAAAQRTLESGEDSEVDLSAPRAVAGRRAGLAVHGTIKPIGDKPSGLAVVYLNDQSEQARMEASRRDFVANVSHELKTPVAAMAVLSEALLESTDDPETVQRFGGKIYDESQRLANMVGELIELSRLQGAERLPDLVDVSVDSVVQEAISRHKVVAEKARIAINTDDATGLQVLGDEALLVTAIDNLISNAVAYSPEGSTVSISRRRVGDIVEIAVTDRGIGIAQADQERVFERFFRVDKARSRATGGTGLGLAIVKHIAANHNGNIRLWSRRGTGSTFTLSIPAYTDPDTETSETEE